MISIKRCARNKYGYKIFALPFVKRSFKYGINEKKRHIASFFGHCDRTDLKNSVTAERVVLRFKGAPRAYFRIVA